MSFTSILYRDETIINDETPKLILEEQSELFGRGYIPEMRGPGEYEYGDAARPFPAELLYSENDLIEIAKEKEQLKARTSDLIFQAKLPYKNQAQTNFCWVNSPVHCVEINRTKQNQRPVSLSPASVGAPLTGYRNIGGWGRNALDRLKSHGCNETANWPDNAIDRKYATPENEERAKAYKVDEWYECRPRNMLELGSAIARGLIGSGGFNWWRHQVTLCDLVVLDARIAVRARNSWPNYGDFGFFIMQGEKAKADDLIFINNVVPS